MDCSIMQWQIANGKTTALQTPPNEGQPTQQAQRIGWDHGSAAYWMNKW